MNNKEFKVEINKLIEDNYSLFLRIARINLLTQYRSEQYEYDVVSEVIIQLFKTFDRNPDKYIKILEKKEMLFYIKSIIYNNCKIKTAPYIRNLKKTNTLPPKEKSLEVGSTNRLWENTVIDIREDDKDIIESLKEGVEWINSDKRPDHITKEMVEVFNTVSTSNLLMGHIAKTHNIRRKDAVNYNNQCIEAIKQHLKK